MEIRRGVKRQDRAKLRLKPPEVFPDGRVRYEAYFSRSGIQEYALEDGSVLREYRDPSEVFSAESLATWRGAPLTLGHPRDFVLPSNAMEHARGSVGDSLARADEEDASYVAGAVTVWDEGLQERIKRGDAELSAGYFADLDMTPGEAGGQKYDARQTNIRINHLAVVDTARGGPKLRLRLDSLDIVADEGEAQMKMVKVNIGGVEYEVPEEVAAELQRMAAALAELEGKAAADKAAADKAAADKAAADKAAAEASAKADAARADAAKAREAEAKARAVADGADSRIAAEVARQVALERAREKLHARADSAGVERKPEMTDEQVTIALVKKLDPTFDEAAQLKDLNSQQRAVYLAARLDAAGGREQAEREELGALGGGRADGPGIIDPLHLIVERQQQRGAAAPGKGAKP